MENEELNKLIVVESLPVIREQLQVISDEVDKEINYALSLECNEDSKIEVKNARARLNKINTLLDEKRKQVKNAIMNPYNEFESVYDELVKNKLKDADLTLKTRINTIEDAQLKEKREELELFAKEHFKFNDIDHLVNFEDIGLNITLSASVKSLKEQILTFCEKIVNDIKLIELEEYRDEILVEYKNTLDFTNSKLNVYIRHKQLEELKEKKENIQEQQQIEEKNEQKINEIVEEITVPKEIFEEEDIITVTFTITDTFSRIKELKNYLLEGGYKYE